MPEYMFDAEYRSRGTICIQADTEEEAMEIAGDFSRLDTDNVAWEEIHESDLEDIDVSSCELNE
jgi:hypothetical protein